MAAIIVHCTDSILHLLIYSMNINNFKKKLPVLVICLLRTSKYDKFQGIIFITWIAALDFIIYIIQLFLKGKTDLSLISHKRVVSAHRRAGSEGN